jgi:hypothetical protein
MSIDSRLKQIEKRLGTGECTCGDGGPVGLLIVKTGWTEEHIEAEAAAVPGRPVCPIHRDVPTLTIVRLVAAPKRTELE